MGLLGLDIGTSGCKATIIDSNGVVHEQTYKEYSMVELGSENQEIDPIIVWESVKEIIKGATNNYRGASIKAISISSFGEAVVAIDKEGEVLTNSIMYTDIRGVEEAETLRKTIGSQRVLEITGTNIHSMYSICKIMWMKKHMPKIFQKVWKFLLFADFILYKLGAKPHTDFSLAARTMAFDITKKHWSKEILEYVDIGLDCFGEPVQSGTVVGNIHAQIADDLGLPKGVLLVSGGHDQACAALGAGVIRSGDAVDGMGTTESITPVFDKPIISQKMAENGFACVPHVIKDMYVTYGFIFTSGAMLKWYRDNFGYEFLEESSNTGKNIYEVIINNATQEPTDLFVLPHFAGAATPYMDAEARGIIMGLNVNSSSRDIIKATLEGITFEMMVNVERMEQAGVSINELRAVGGLAKSETFLQLKADMMGKVISSLDISESGTLGVVILAGKAAGIFGSYEEAVEKLVKIKKRYFPNNVRGAFYKRRFETYKKIYPAIKVINGR